MNDLKPCPFCGGEAGEYADGALVSCAKCGVEMYGQNPSDSVARWNRRLEAASAERGEEKVALAVKLDGGTIIVPPDISVSGDFYLVPTHSLALPTPESAVEEALEELEWRASDAVEVAHSDSGATSPTALLGWANGTRNAVRAVRAAIRRAKEG